jgi:hypothetical protein
MSVLVFFVTIPLLMLSCFSLKSILKRKYCLAEMFNESNFSVSVCMWKEKSLYDMGPIKSTENQRYLQIVSMLHEFVCCEVILS